MKISFFRHSLLNRGGDKMVLEHGAYLAGAGHDIAFHVNQVETVFTIHPKLQLKAIPRSGKWGTIASAMLDKLDSDVVVADIIPMSLLLFLRNGRRVVYYAQDYNEDTYPTLMQKWFVRFLYFLGLVVLRIPVIAVSEELAEIFRKRFRVDCNLVRNGINHKVFYPDPLPEFLGTKSGKAVLFFARNDFRKGFDLIPQIVGLAASRSSVPLEFWAVGEEIAFESGVCGRNFGYVTEEKLRKIFSSVDVFLYPSRFEGFPLMVMEAFACGCPVVTTDAVSYARNDVNALVGKTGDVEGLTKLLLRIVEDPEAARKVAAGGFAFALDHSLERSSTQFEAALLGLTQRA